MKRFVLSMLSVFCCLALLLCGCGGADTSDKLSSSDAASTDASDTAKTGYYNNLTGLYELDSKEKESARPLAVMINNITIAQKVQTGLKSASIVYETFVEGGITRLMAVFKDSASIPQLGSLRSARYSYVDLACGHDAVYVHAGLDPNYCKAYMDELNLDDYDLNTGYGAPYQFRVNNGLATEHTMFSNGELLAAAMKDANRRMTVDEKHAGAWANFADEDVSVKPSGDDAQNVSVYFSGSYVTNFAYDSDLGLYKKSNRGTPCVDADSGDVYSYKNVFVLFTKVGRFSDNYRMYSELNGGEGYYICNGKYQPITWSKGGTYDSFRFMDEAGNDLTVNAGNSYVCITDKDLKQKTTIG